MWKSDFCQFMRFLACAILCLNFIGTPLIMALTWSSLILMDHMIWWWWIDHLMIWFWVHPPSLPLFRVGTDGYFNHSVHRNGISVYAYKYKVSRSFEEDLFEVRLFLWDILLFIFIWVYCLKTGAVDVEIFKQGGFSFLLLAVLLAILLAVLLAVLLLLARCGARGNGVSRSTASSMHDQSMSKSGECGGEAGAWCCHPLPRVVRVLGRRPVPSRLSTWGCRGGPGFGVLGGVHRRPSLVPWAVTEAQGLISWEASCAFPVEYLGL